MKEIHVGESVRVGSRSEEVRGTVVDLDRRPGYGRLIIDSDELSIEAAGRGPKLQYTHTRNGRPNPGVVKDPRFAKRA